MPSMAIGAEFLRRRGHRPRPFMLGVALDAAPLRLVEGLGETIENTLTHPGGCRAASSIAVGALACAMLIILCSPV